MSDELNCSIDEEKKGNRQEKRKSSSRVIASKSVSLLTAFLKSSKLHFIVITDVVVVEKGLARYLPSLGRNTEAWT